MSVKTKDKIKSKLVDFLMNDDSTGQKKPDDIVFSENTHQQNIELTQNARVKNDTYVHSPSENTNQHERLDITMHAMVQKDDYIKDTSTHEVVKYPVKTAVPPVANIKNEFNPDNEKTLKNISAPVSPEFVDTSKYRIDDEPKPITKEADETLTGQAQGQTLKFKKNIDPLNLESSVVEDRKYPISLKPDHNELTPIIRVDDLQDQRADANATQIMQKPASNFPPLPKQEARYASKPQDHYYQGEALLQQAETLNLAQDRISELEHELDSLRSENEELQAGGEVLKRRADEFQANIESLERRKREVENNLKDELAVVQAKLTARDKDNLHLRVQVESLELRLKADLKKVRVRERELENRLEIAKAEHAAIVRSKDELILELKRSMDQLSIEMDNYRNKAKQVSDDLQNNQERVRRSVKAMRLALSLLDGEDLNMSGSTDRNNTDKKKVS